MVLCRPQQLCHLAIRRSLQQGTCCAESPAMAFCFWHDMVCEQVVLRTQGGSLCREGSYAVKPPAPEGFEATWHESRDRTNRKWTLCRQRCQLAVACTVLWLPGRYIDRQNDTHRRRRIDVYVFRNYVEEKTDSGCKLNCCVNMTWQKNGPKCKYLLQMEAFGLSTSLGNSWWCNRFWGL